MTGINIKTAIMKTKLLFIAFVLLAPLSQAATTVKTSYFEVADSMRLFDLDGSDGQGYKYTTFVKVNWPVAVNGRFSDNLNHFLLDSLFHVYEHPDIFPYYPSDMETLTGFLNDVVHCYIDQETEHYKKVSLLDVPDLNCEECPMRCWYDNVDVDLSHTYGDLVFIKAYYDNYAGGTHNSYQTNYLVFDARLDKPMKISDFVTSPKKLLRMVPRYDHRRVEIKQWNNITVDNINNFYIKNGKMVFVFAPYAIGPYCNGEVEVPVPIKALRAQGLLTAYAKQKLKCSAVNF